MKKIFIFILLISTFNACKNKNSEVIKDNVIDVSLYEKNINSYYVWMIGETVKDFTTLDRNRKSIQLSQVYKNNKLVLLEFWSSKCIPCRKENPNLVNLYQQYQSKGFEIISVSVDDNKQNWIKAIEQDKLSWIQICDLKAWNGAIPRQFNITETPTLFLIDKSGVIVDVNLKGESLQSKMKAIFN